MRSFGHGLRILSFFAPSAPCANARNPRCYVKISDVHDELGRIGSYLCVNLFDLTTEFDARRRHIKGRAKSSAYGIGSRFSCDGLQALSSRSSSLKVELRRVWTGDDGKEREWSRWRLCRKSSEFCLGIAEV
jgi:hypothetical protein